MGCDIYLARQCDTEVQHRSNKVPMCGYFSCANNVGMIAVTEMFIAFALRPWTVKTRYDVFASASHTPSPYLAG